MRCFNLRKCAAIILAITVLALSIPIFADTWSAGVSLLSVRHNFGAETIGKKIYVMGGDANGFMTRTVQVFDSETGNWEVKSDMPRSKDGFGTAILNQKIYLVGGYTSSYGQNLFEEYDPTTDTWTLKKNLPTERTALGVATVNGKIYAIGGHLQGGASIAFRTVEEYDPATDSWTKKSDMPTGRRSFAVGVVNGKIYAIGGYVYGTTPNIINTVEEYDPSTDTWTTKSPMPTARCDLQVEVIDGKIYAIGGQYATIDKNVVECYDPATDKWITCEPMPITQSKYFRTTTLDGKIFVMGGYKGIFTSSDLVQIFVPTPSQPLNLIAAPGNTQISLSWDGIQSATGYNVKRSLTPGGPYETIRTTVDTSFIDTTVTNGTTYYYIVTAVNSGGESKNSNEASATPYTDGIPTNLFGTWDGGIILSWDSVVGATGYNVKRSLTSGGPYTIIASNVSTSFYFDKDAIPGTNYYYVVSAVNANGESANSNELLVTPDM